MHENHANRDLQALHKGIRRKHTGENDLHEIHANRDLHDFHANRDLQIQGDLQAFFVT